jgi:hypothetical protein
MSIDVKRPGLTLVSHWPDTGLTGGFFFEFFVILWLPYQDFDLKERKDRKPVHTVVHHAHNLVPPCVSKHSFAIITPHRSMSASIAPAIFLSGFGDEGCDDWTILWRGFLGGSRACARAKANEGVDSLAGAGRAER